MNEPANGLLCAKEYASIEIARFGPHKIYFTALILHKRNLDTFYFYHRHHLFAPYLKRKHHLMGSRFSDIIVIFFSKYSFDVRN